MWYDDWDDPECEHEFAMGPLGTHEWCQKCDLVRPVAATREHCCYDGIECRSGASPDPGHEDSHDVGLK
jgi:hypothetical protein